METTLEVLQSYPLGTLQVEFVNWRNADETHPRGILRGLYMTDVDQYAAVDFGEQDRGIQEVEARYCIPRLRPFSALCTPLEGGEVPAIEVAKLLANDWANENSYDILPSVGAVAGLNGFVLRVYEVGGYMDEGDTEGGTISLYSDWTFMEQMADGTITNLSNLVEVFDYLRKHHFAVGLNSTDFIAK